MNHVMLPFSPTDGTIHTPFSIRIPLPVATRVHHPLGVSQRSFGEPFWGYPPWQRGAIPIGKRGYGEAWQMAAYTVGHGQDQGTCTTPCFGNRVVTMIVEGGVIGTVGAVIQSAMV